MTSPRGPRHDPRRTAVCVPISVATVVANHQWTTVCPKRTTVRDRSCGAASDALHQNAGMPIQIATANALRGAAALRSLVDAVVAADEHDESDWIEWKGQLDVATKEGCSHIARAVLGLANRDPERAEVTVEGLGYVVAGAEPGALHGLTSVDPAQLGQLIEPYLGGADGPAWAPLYVPLDDKIVLVVTVEAPKPGDPIRTLRREFGKYREGTIFVRKHGRTEVADAADIEALQRRLLASGRRAATSLAVRVIGDVPLSWFDAGALTSQIKEWAEARRAQLVHAAREVERQRQAPADASETEALGGFGSIGHAVLPGVFESLAAVGQHLSALSPIEEDTRTLADFEQEVTDWADDVTAVAQGVLPGRYVHAGHGVIRLEVENLGSRFLPDVELDVIFDTEMAKALNEKPEWDRLPAEPRAYGEARRRNIYAPLVPSSPVFMPGGVPAFRAVGRRTWAEDGSMRVRWQVGDLRQYGRQISDDVYVFLASRPDDGMLHGTWRATVRDADGETTGTVDVPVSDAAVGVPALLELTRKRT